MAMCRVAATGDYMLTGGCPWPAPSRSLLGVVAPPRVALGARGEPGDGLCLPDAASRTRGHFSLGALASAPPGRGRARPFRPLAVFAPVTRASADSHVTPGALDRSS